LFAAEAPRDEFVFWFALAVGVEGGELNIWVERVQEVCGNVIHDATAAMTGYGRRPSSKLLLM
jgi:hypothetical protein